MIATLKPLCSITLNLPLLFLRAFFLGTLFLAVLLITACSPSSEYPLRIATNTWPGYEPLYLARNLGYYQNTPIKLVELTSSSDVMHALKNGNLEGAALTLDETLTLISRGAELKVVLVMDISHGGDVLLVKPEVESLSQLKGKKIAVEYTAVGALLLDSVLKKAQLENQDVQIVACNIDQHLQCYEENDAVITFEPNISKLRSKGAKILFDSSQMPGQIIDVLVVHKSTISSHPNALRQLLAGYFKAREYFSDNPKKSAEIMSPRLQVTSDKVLALFQGIKLPTLTENHQLLFTENPQLNVTSAQLALFMLERELLKTVVNTHEISQGQFLPAITHE